MGNDDEGEFAICMDSGKYHITVGAVYRIIDKLERSSNGQRLVEVIDNYGNQQGVYAVRFIKIPKSFMGGE